MSKSVRKVFVTAVIAAVAMSVAAPAHAQTTTAELQALIASLQAQINQLLAQISGLGGGGGVATGIPAGFTFNQNLAQGASSQDVMYLQKALNAYNNSPIASSGAGSRGSETQFFGPITRSGVVAFQNKYASKVLIPVGLTSGTGFVGPSTRAQLNSLLAGAPGTTPPPGVIGTPGLEGSLIVTVNSNPASGAIFNESVTKAVGAVDVKVTGSDILLNRLDLNFSKRAWLYVSEITVSDGTTSKTIAVTQSNTTEITVGSDYMVRVDGLNILAPKDTTKTLTVTVKAVSSLPGTETSTAVTLTFGANSVRGTDGAGLNQIAPNSSAGTRTFTVESASDAALEITANAGNPKEQVILVNSTAETTGVILAVIDVKAKNNDAILRTVKFQDIDIDTDASGTISVAYLYEGNTLLSSTSSLAAAATSTFANVNLTIPKDTTKTLTLKADLRKASGNYAEGATSTIVVRATANGFSAEDATTFASVAVTGSNVAPGSAHFYTKAPKIVLANKTMTEVESGTASSSPQSWNAKFTLDITALGGDIYVPIFGTDASSGILAAKSVASTTFTTTYTSAADFGDSDNDTYVIRSGTTESFEVSGNIAACGTVSLELGTSSFVKMTTTDIKWGTTVGAAQIATDNIWTWGLSGYASPEGFLPLCS